MPEIEHYTWADKVVDELRNRNVKEHVVHGMWTPSGYFHIGNARSELITPMLVYTALRDAGLPAKFNFFVDDFDDLDKIPSDVDCDRRDFDGWLGKPLHIVPSPISGFRSWSDYFAADIRNNVEKFGSRPNWHSSYDEYKKGTYDNAIRIVLNNWQKANYVWEKIAKAKKEKDQLPVMVVCENCERNSTTFAYEWDQEKVKYKCKQNRPYAEACGYEGEVVPEKGKVKLPWRLHWPATWFTFGTTFESGGKDHFATTGSVDTGKAFCKEIFNIQPPVLIGVEFVTIDGKKISGSLGNGISLTGWSEIIDPEILRFIYASYQLQTVIEIDIRSNKFFLLTDRYDEAERCHYGSSSTTEKRTAQLKRQYELAQTKKPPEEAPVQLPYSTAVMLVQSVPTDSMSSIVKILKPMGPIKREMTEEDEKRIRMRLDFARNWTNKYAPEDVKIKINEEAPKQIVAGLTGSERKSVEDFRKEIRKHHDESGLQSMIYEIARSNNIEPKNFFRILYRMIISKDAGPRLGPFIIALGKERVDKILEI